MTPDELDEMQPMWTTDRGRYQIRVSAGEDPIEAGSIVIVARSGRMVGARIIEDEELWREVKRRMIEAGVPVVTDPTAD